MVKAQIKPKETKINLQNNLNQTPKLDNKLSKIQDKKRINQLNPANKSIKKTTKRIKKRKKLSRKKDTPKRKNNSNSQLNNNQPSITETKPLRS